MAGRKRIFCKCISVVVASKPKSGTRKEDLLVGKDTLNKMYVLRRILNPMGTLEAMEFLLDKLRLTKTNSDFFNSMNQ